MRFALRSIRAYGIAAFAIGACQTVWAAEKASEQVNPFYGSFSHAIPIDVPSYKGLEPRLALTYSSEGRNGIAGVGWNLSGVSRIERANVGRGTPHFEADDIFLLDGQELVACQQGSPSPSCTTGSGSNAGTHSTKNESYLRIRFDSTGNTWTVWGKDGTRTVFSPIFTVPPSGYVAGGTLIWGQTSAIDTHNNTVTYSWSCVGGDCYPNSIAYNGYQITFYREDRPDPQSFAAATVTRQMLYRLRSVIVQLGGAPIRGYQLAYSVSALTGRSLLGSVQQYGKNLQHSGGAITAGTFLPAQTFTYQDDAIGKSFVDWSGSAGGAATEPVTWASPVNASITGTGYNLTKTSGVDGDWDAGATSTRAITSGIGYLEFTSTETNTQRIIGLSNGSGSSDPNEIDFGLCLTTENKMYVIENGVISPTLFSRAEGDTLRIEVTPTSVAYKRNGTVFHAHAASPIYPLLTDSSIRTANATIAGAVISGTLGYVKGWCQGSVFLTGDFNGDGRTDQLCYTYSLTDGMPSNYRIRVALATATGFASPAIWLSDNPLVQPAVGDWNGDGKADIVDHEPNANFSVMLSTGSSFGARTLWGNATGIGPDQHLHACNGSLAFVSAGDFNGDGLQDVSCKRVDSDAVHVGLSNGSSAFSFGVWAQLKCQTEGDRAAGGIDFDGDGKDDWYCIGVTNGVLAVFPSNGGTFLPFVGGAIASGFCPSENYVLGDVNGDGRTDVSCTVNGRVILSMGRLWAPSTGDAGLWCNGGNAFPADLDGDGASELVCNNYGDGPHDIQVRKWNGTGLGAMETWKPSWCAGNVRPGDWNGDGKTDLYCDSANYSAVAGTGGTQADLATAIGNGLGGTTTVAYTPASAFSNTNAPPPKFTVTSLTAADGRGWSATSTFSYSGGKMDRKERMFLGFYYARQTLPCIDGESACPYVETLFRQDLPALGRLATVVNRDGANNLHGIVSYEYTTNEPAVPRTALLTGERAHSFDGTGCPTWPCSTQKTTYAAHQYDAYGNEVASSFSGDESASGDETSTTRGYTYNTAAYIVDRPSTQLSFGPTGAQLTKSEFCYDGASNSSQPPTKGDVTNVRLWLAEESRWVETDIQYDNWGNATHSWDETDRLTTTVFDPTHHEFPISVTNAAGETESVVWDPICGSPSVHTDENQQVTVLQTDDLCRPERTDFPLGHYEERSYLALGNPNLQRTVVLSPSPTGSGGTQRAIAYFDGLGRSYRSVLKAGGSGGPDIQSDTTFNQRGQVATVTAPHYWYQQPQATTYVYDNVSRLTSTVFADGNSVAAQYGLWSVASRDEHGHWATTYLDAYGRTTSTLQDTENGLVTTTMTYDPLGRLVGLIDSIGISWSWTYDSLGRQTASVDPNAGAWTYEYDDAGRLEVQQDAKGQVTQLTYDAAGRLESKTTCASSEPCPGGSGPEVVTLHYGEARAGFYNVGRLTSVLGPSTQSSLGPQLTLDYDQGGRNTRTMRSMDGQSYVLTRRYDAAGRLLGVTYPDGDVIGSAADPITYDNHGRLLSIPGILNSVQYDASGRATEQANFNGTTTTRTFSETRGFLQSISTSAFIGPVQDVQDVVYTRDSAGLVTGMTNSIDAEDWTYTYDTPHRLLTATSKQPSQSEAFTYDRSGRMTWNQRVGTYSYPTGSAARPHAPTSAGSHSYTYDPNGNLEHDNAPGAGRTITWNASNLPVSIQSASGTTTFAYDGSGERVKKVSASSSSLYPLGDDFEITDGVITKYISAPGLGVVAKRVGSEPFWLHTDQLGSIQAVTNLDGEVVQRRTYRPYGDELSETTGHVESRGYIDQRQDPETSLLYLHARYYDPDAGLFLSPDPLAPHAGMNPYTYGLADPINNHDRIGLVAERAECGSGSCFIDVDVETGFRGWPLIFPAEVSRRGLPPTGSPKSPSAGGLLGAVFGGIADFLFGGGGGGPATPQSGEGHESNGREPRERHQPTAPPDVRPVPPPDDESPVPPVQPPQGAVGGALSSIGDSMRSIGMGAAGSVDYFLTGNTRLALRAYELGPLGQTAGAPEYNKWTKRSLKLSQTATEAIVSIWTGRLLGAPEPRFFGNLGPEWHVGLETVGKMNYVHFGRSLEHGVHLAFGAHKPMYAYYHLYFQKAFPYFRTWHP